ncbi:isochorismatase family cysteine hydrolase [uncultured Roseibium sp.]|uniref:isochorismatase family cysteine hydrolase n=1 Tax=uncultured Roseibium sp. TaxID=1936171 RepID=UPI002609CDDB|nr:isochorismatase family cysteine hydrolase [uncultured Roseibium sp.]
MQDVPSKQANIGLLIIDVQKGFVSPATTHIPAIVEELQDSYAHVAASRFINRPNSPHRRFLGWNRLLPDTEETELAFTPSSGAFVFEKPQYSAVSYDLLRWIHLNRLSEVHLCGIDTEICVLTSATALFEVSVKPVVLAWACASGGGAEGHAAGLVALRRLIGRDNVWADGSGKSCFDIDQE